MINNTKAWMLRQDGVDFPVKVHLYVMFDNNLSSEAEVASFLIKTNSQDQDIAKLVIDGWLAMLIEDSVPYTAMAGDICNCIEGALSKLAYRFPYPLSTKEYLEIHNSQNNYYDVDSLYGFIDEMRDRNIELSNKLARSLNQQFIRVRFGGEYNNEAHSNALWFRVGSVGYNWANTIYVWTANNYRKLRADRIFICRDAESDGTLQKPEYFYKAKDGEYYYDMPIDEYFREDHEHSPVFSAVGLGFYRAIYCSLCNGNTYLKALDSACSQFDVVEAYDNIFDRYSKWRENEITKSCICASEFLDNANARTRSKFTALKRQLLHDFPEIDDVDIDVKPGRENSKGKPVGCEVIFTLESEMIPEINGMEVSTVYNHPVCDLAAGIMLRSFRIEYTDYCDMKHIDRSFRPDKLMDGYVWGADEDCDVSQW